MPWGRLWSYEKQQGGYWDYATAIDAYGVHVRKYLKVKAVPHAGMTWANFVVGADVEVHGEYDVTWTSIKEVASAGVLGS